MTPAKFRFLYFPAALSLALLSGQALSAQVAHAPAAAAAHAAAPAPASVPPNTVVIRVGTTAITAQQFQQMLDAFPPQQRPQVEAHKRDFAQYLANYMALAQEAKAEHLDQTPEFKLHEHLLREQTLAQALLQSLRQTLKPTDAQVTAFYNGHQDMFQEAKVRHILIATAGGPGGSKLTPAQALAKANAVEARLKKGEDFATVAKSVSDDTGSKTHGGDLGWVTHHQMVPSFDKAVWSLPVNQISAPVKTRFGYHIIQVQERKTAPLSEAKDQIAEQLQNQLIQEKLQQIKAAAGVVLNPTYFGAAPSAAAAAPGAQATTASAAPAHPAAH